MADKDRPKPERLRALAALAKAIKAGDQQDDIEKKATSDFTAPDAARRVFFLNLGILKYGTDDKVHGAAIFFSLALLAIILIVILVGFASENSAWLDRVFTWLGSAFMFSAGVAIGRSHGHGDD